MIGNENGVLVKLECELAGIGNENYVLVKLECESAVIGNENGDVDK
ncbi:hypothetical protein P4U44_13505 [Alkalihalobacillus alcalophilus]|nr:hypothetical protein [Alkalihalobacillus alcalophilus]MED1562890.1 hypothetical protein [Alkalihalobacillus alcalophilus]